MLYPLLGVAAATGILAIYQAGTGGPPGALSIVHLYLIGLGIGLVSARIGKLGPFEGVLGAPWYESRIQETLHRESARALRYDRALTIVAMRRTTGRKAQPQAILRATDQLLRCRDGWVLLILPETDLESAILLLRRAYCGSDILAVLVSPDPQRPHQRIDGDLLSLIRASDQPGIVALRGHCTPDFVPLAR